MKAKSLEEAKAWIRELYDEQLVSQNNLETDIEYSRIHDLPPLSHDTQSSDLKRKEGQVAILRYVLRAVFDEDL